MILIVGRTCSGKNTYLEHLLSNGDYKKLISYTTRPKRNNEVDGIDYHFIGKNDIPEMEKRKTLLFKTEIGGYEYFTVEEDFNKYFDNGVKIVDPKGVQDILKYLIDNDIKDFVEVHYITTKVDECFGIGAVEYIDDFDVRKERYLKRGGSPYDFINRHKAEDLRFMNFEFMINRLIRENKVNISNFKDSKIIKILYKG